MSEPICPVVIENLAEQISATQGGVVHASQLLPYLPVNIGLIDQVLNRMAESDHVARHAVSDLSAYVFRDSLCKSPCKFAPSKCVYSNESLDSYEYSVLAPIIRHKVEAELKLMAEDHVWPSEAVWEHELFYLIDNLPAPVTTSTIAGHSRLPLAKVEQRLKELKQRGDLEYHAELKSWTQAPSRYPEAAYARNDAFIRKFPGAIKEEFENRLIKALGTSFGILALSFLLAITAKFPFPLVALGGSALALIFFMRIIKAPAKQIPAIYPS